MAISDRIAVMKDGIIQQVGTPREIYHRPANIFVAAFIGRTNLVEARYSPDGGKVRGDGFEFAVENVDCPAESPVILAIRPEDFRMAAGPGDGIRSTIRDSVFLGMNTHFQAVLPGGQPDEIIHESVLDGGYRAGDTVSLGIKTGRINVFSADGSRNLVRPA